MTIAIGILATDGIVVAADTQESFGSIGQMTTDANKITIGELNDPSSGLPPRCTAASGAGSAGYLDSFMPKVVDWFNRTKETDPS
jgi:CubicO group peptidase (beta-lactamase class C family)